VVPDSCFLSIEWRRHRDSLKPCDHLERDRIGVVPFPMAYTRPGEGRGHNTFSTTSWSVVLAAGNRRVPESHDALTLLYRKYWRPLYAFARRRGWTMEEAEDLTQDFFTSLLEKDYLRVADRSRGRFRSFLLVAFKHFLANEWDKTQAQKRGGGKARLSLEAPWERGEVFPEPAYNISPERAYEREWASTVLNQVMDRLRAESARTSRQEVFDVLREHILGFPGVVSYRSLSIRLGVSEGAVKTAIHRLRRQFRSVLREEIAQTVSDPSQIDNEIRHFLHALTL
jgi:RNA polymerase sigma factor (sigma-70 family)